MPSPYRMLWMAVSRLTASLGVFRFTTRPRRSAQWKSRRRSCLGSFAICFSRSFRLLDNTPRLACSTADGISLERPIVLARMP